MHSPRPLLNTCCAKYKQQYCMPDADDVWWIDNDSGAFTVGVPSTPCSLAPSHFRWDVDTDDAAAIMNNAQRVLDAIRSGVLDDIRACGGGLSIDEDVLQNLGECSEHSNSSSEEGADAIFRYYDGPPASITAARSPRKRTSPSRLLNW